MDHYFRLRWLDGALTLETLRFQVWLAKPPQVLPRILRESQPCP